MNASRQKGTMGVRRMEMNKEGGRGLMLYRIIRNLFVLVMYVAVILSLVAGRYDRATFCLLAVVVLLILDGNERAS